MGHQPFESWILSNEPLLPEEEQRLNKHIAKCESCQEISTAWQEVEDIFTSRPLAEPKTGFTGRWLFRLEEMNKAEIARRQRRSSWMFFGVMAGAALVILSILMIQFVSSIHGPVQLFITGITMLAGLLTLAEAVQVAFIPFVEVLIVSVPPIWWFFIAFGASILTMLLAISVRQILNPRRVSL